MPVSAILTLISMNGRVQMNDRNQRNLVQVLERDGFRKRSSANRIYEYEVVQYKFEEMERNCKMRKEKEGEINNQQSTINN